MCCRLWSCCRTLSIRGGRYLGERDVRYSFAVCQSLHAPRQRYISCKIYTVWTSGIRRRVVFTRSSVSKLTRNVIFTVYFLPCVKIDTHLRRLTPLFSAHYSKSLFWSSRAALHARDMRRDATASLSRAIRVPPHQPHKPNRINKEQNILWSCSCVHTIAREWPRNCRGPFGIPIAGQKTPTSSLCR